MRTITESPSLLLNPPDDIRRRRTFCSSQIIEDENSPSLIYLHQSKEPILRNDVKDDLKIKVFVESLEILASLAKMDSEKWKETLCDTHVQTFSSSDSDISAAKLQGRFDHLQSQWKFEETSIPQLIQSIHHFHSKCIHLEAHSDHVSEENKFLREELIKSKNHVHKLEHTVKKIHKKKEMLNDKIQSMKSQREILLKGMHNYACEFYEAQVSREGRQMANHERIMKLVDTENKNFSSSVEGTTANGASTSSSEMDVEKVSCITNDGVATVQIGETIPVPTDKSDKGSLTLHYPVNSKVGLQFHQMQLIRSATPKKDKPFYPLQQFMVNQPLIPSKVEKQKEQYAFYVCGHHGFNHDLNTVPPIGARLTAVNENDVDNNMASLSNIRSYITAGMPFTLSFKIEPLLEEQNKVLLEAEKTATKKFAKKSKRRDE